MNDQIGEPYISIIPSAKKDLLEKTNIETSKEEMACLDNFLFRCWQMGWLKQYEPKKEEGWDKAIKEAKKKYGYGKPEERIDVVRDFSPYGKTVDLGPNESKGKEKSVFYSKTFPPTIEERLDLLERYLGISKHKMNKTVATLFVEQGKRLAKIENRLTEIEGALRTIGSPGYSLRKKVEALEIQAKHFACYIPNVSYELKND